MRWSLIAIAGLLAIGGAAAAEPPKSAANQPAETQPRPAAIVLASAEAVRAPAIDSAQPASAPAKRRIAPRVTSCRCGDPQVQADPQAQ